MYIDWQLGDVCNFKCSYCNFDSKGGASGWPSLNQSINFVNQILDHSDHEYRTYNLLGGEPTLWRDFGSLCQYIKEKDTDCLIQTLTNGSRTIRWWQTYAQYIDKIVISYHHASNTVGIDHIIKVIETCQKFSSVSVQVLMDISCFDACVDAYNTFIANCPGVKISVKKGETELGSRQWMPYSEEQDEWMVDSIQVSDANNKLPAKINRETSNKKYNRELYGITNDNRHVLTSNKELIINKQNHFEGWNCNIGIDMVSIKADGRVFPASACFKESMLGNYRHGDDIAWPTKSYICKYKGCFCGADIEVEKYV